MWTALLLLAPLASPQDVDPARGLRSKDPLERLAAVERLAAEPHPKRAALLERALEDDDWEVAVRAAEALGTVPFDDEDDREDAAEALAEVALEGPIARLRRVAATSLAAVDAEEGFDELARKVTGDRAEAACLAMVALAVELDGEASLRPAERALESDDGAARAAAARALVALAGDARAARLGELFERSSARVRCAAVEAAGASGDPALVGVLLARLAAPEPADVVRRRVAAALAELLAALDGAEREDAVAAVVAAPAEAPPEARAFLVRALGRVAAREVGLVPPADVLPALDAVHRGSAVDVRAAVADALGRVGTDPALLLASGIARGDESPRVRRAALRAVTRRRDAAESEDARALFVDLLGDEDAGVRADAAVALAAKGVDAAVAPLAARLDDPDWRVAVCAAVSLGKTRAPGARGPLVALRASEDWRLRGAAVVGLGHLYDKEAVPHVIAALEDPDPVVRATARAYLVSIANREIEPEVDAWRAWWEDAERGIVLFDPEEERARRERYGYERPAAEIYAGLDVLVLESRGDHIQDVLADLGIEHRLTRQGQVGEDAPHARAVFVSNCTGAITDEDVECLAWFVHAGGYLFGSCWAVQETIARAVPGVVRRLPTRGEVMDDVPAAPCAPRSPYLEGVFPPDVTPVYALVGAYLIDVLDPERCQVLVDSPACHDRWGGGNLAAWFPAGHGVALDSVNHFDEQGLARATHLREAEERQAYAVDHLGLSLEALRETADERWWRKTHEAAERVKDRSVFRLITNFVRRKRIEGDG